MSGLRDASGAIVIDEAEAEEDIRSIELARSKLDEAKQILDPAKIDSERMYGMTRDALEEQFARITGDLNDWEERCEASIRYIRKIVAEYQRIDKEYARKAEGLK